MEANPYVSTSLNDIIFEGRNKAYGAYQLRQLYHYNLFKASIFSAAAFLLFLGLYFYAANQNAHQAMGAKIPPLIKESSQVVLMQEEIVFEKPKTPAAPPTSIQKTATRQFREPRIVTNETPVTTTIPNQNSFDQADLGLEDGVGEPVVGVIPAEITGSGGTGEIELAVTETFNFVEIMPEYEQGGQAGMLKFIYKHLRFPRMAQEQGLAGTVIVSFVVSPTGDITGIQVLQDIGGGAGEEAVRVISKMPKWKPGIQNQRAVPVRMTLPIRFKLN